MWSGYVFFVAVVLSAWILFMKPFSFCSEFFRFNGAPQGFLNLESHMNLDGQITLLLDAVIDSGWSCDLTQHFC